MHWCSNAFGGQPPPEISPLISPLTLCLTMGHLMAITVTLSSAFHPQTNGHAERTVQELEVDLRCLCMQEPSLWGKNWAWVEYAHKYLHVS